MHADTYCSSYYTVFCCQYVPSNDWLASNRLPLNTPNTQFIWLGGGRQLAGIDRRLVTEALPNITFLDSVGDFGIILEQELHFSNLKEEEKFFMFNFQTVTAAI